jgi:hypothetical protein
MRRNIATRRRKKSDGGEIRRRLWNGNRNKNRSLWAIDNRIADIEPRGYSPCRIELDNPADIHRKSGVGFTEFASSARYFVKLNVNLPPPPIFVATPPTPLPITENWAPTSIFDSSD